MRAAKGMGAQFLPTDTGDPERLYDSREDPDDGNCPSRRRLHRLRRHLGQRRPQARSRPTRSTSPRSTATGSGVLTAWAGRPRPEADRLDGELREGRHRPEHGGRARPATYDAHDRRTTAASAIQNLGSGHGAHHRRPHSGYYVTDDSVGLRFTPLTAPDAPAASSTRATAPGSRGRSGPADRAHRRRDDGDARPDSVYVVGNTTGDPARRRAPTSRCGAGRPRRPSASNLNVSPGRDPGGVDLRTAGLRRRTRR